jgi:hypothetical protein
MKQDNPYMDGYQTGYEQALKDVEAFITPSAIEVQLLIADLRKRVAL